MQPTFKDLATEPTEDSLPHAERRETAYGALGGFQRDWRNKGVVVLEKFIPREIIDAYCAVRERLGLPGGWPSNTPYEHVPELRNLCLYSQLCSMLRYLIGEEMGLHLNLSGWVSTERNWHQDGYLNPAGVGSYYAAVWIALDRIYSDAGPFEYVPGSHRWGEITQASAFRYLTPAEQRDPNWPKYSERFLTAAFENEVRERQAPVQRFLAEKGDVLIWNSRLMHRGSAPATPGKQRKAIIAHYSGLGHRPDMPKRLQHTTGGWYFVFGNPLMSLPGQPSGMS